MLQSVRNQIFEEKVPLIDLVVKKHYSRIAAYSLCKEDIWQDLALRMLCLLDMYDPNKCANLDAFLVQQLTYELLRLTMPSKRYGIPHAPRKKNFRVVSLEERISSGHLSRVVLVKVKKKKPFQMIRRRLRCWLANTKRREAVPCA